MISVSLDESYVFDMLSILDVKIKKLNNEKFLKTQNFFNLMKSEIIEQIGEEKFLKIINSELYKDLYNSNLHVFELVDLVKKEGGLAKIVDDANYKRYECKMNLQNYFFNTEMNECKDSNY